MNYDESPEPAIAYSKFPMAIVSNVCAGASGSSVAYYLHQYAAEASIPVNITVFERSSRAGGRTTTVHAYNNPTFPVELGGSIFVEVNRILVDAVRRFNLSTGSASIRTGEGSDPPVLGIWNGERFVLTAKDEMGWWDLAKLLWKYGYAPIKTRNLMKNTVERFLKLYDEKFPWASLSDVVEELGLLAETAVTGKQYLKNNGISDLFANEVVQASTRVNYAQNIGLVHGLVTMICMATDGAIAVNGGNWQIFDNMVRFASEDLRFHTNVTAISRHEDGKYTIRSKNSWFLTETEETFDEVILATPHQFSSVDLSGATTKIPDAIPYVHLHVTLLASPHVLSPGAFSLPSNKQAPAVVLTTLGPDEDYGAHRHGVGKPNFWSISTLRPIINPKTGGSEFLYKIFSPEPVNETFLAHIFGLRTTFTNSSDEYEIKEEDFPWIYPHIWHSYPYTYPRLTFEELRLDEGSEGQGGLWYTGGMDAFASTMETNSLMGRNIAGLIAKKWKEEDDKKR
ncbi:prenylcysteine lyase [Patellaria atrata CBS 101060]|uniref:Prenylcysteine lyase n=1 Tax=Patellaria atrata CBS 101060 TaxID=1346257 RepID=A0A9P4S543_9PEZI|nr:prenylcysteine lyase [Patellaria atrata CBS 101060]